MVRKGYRAAPSRFRNRCPGEALRQLLMLLIESAFAGMILLSNPMMKFMIYCFLAAVSIIVSLPSRIGIRFIGNLLGWE